MSFKPISIVAALALGFAAPVAAAQFTFQYSPIEGGVVTGSFSGISECDFILGIGNIAAAYNETPFNGTINAYDYFGYNSPGCPTIRRRRTLS